MSLGPAGTGKFFSSIYCSNVINGKKLIELFYLTAVEAGEKCFLPGDMKEKVDPYLRPL